MTLAHVCVCARGVECVLKISHIPLRRVIPSLHPAHFYAHDAEARKKNIKALFHCANGDRMGPTFSNA